MHFKFIMIEYFRDGIIEQHSSHQAYFVKIKEPIFQFFYAQVMNCICHPLMYCAIIIWESLQGACLLVIPAEENGFSLEINFQSMYISPIIVYILCSCYMAINSHLLGS